VEKSNDGFCPIIKQEGCWIFIVILRVGEDFLINNKILNSFSPPVEFGFFRQKSMFFPRCGEERLLISKICSIYEKKLFTRVMIAT
jgi:hypothetical protein